MLFILFLLPIFLLFADMLFERIYTPPALTADKVSIYKECLEVFRKYPQYDITILIHYFIIKNESGLSFNSMIDQEEMKEYFFGEDMKQFERLGSLLKSVDCIKAEKLNNVVLFYNYEGRHFILPEAPGVLYSFSGRNPNEINNGTLEQFKPFTHLKNNWYYSPKLVLSRSRKQYIRKYIPKALIDHSAKLPKGAEL